MYCHFLLQNYLQIGPHGSTYPGGQSPSTTTSGPTTATSNGPTTATTTSGNNQCPGMNFTFMKINQT